MKKKLLAFCCSLAVVGALAQQPTIGTATVIPQNPTVADFIKIVTKVTTPNQGIQVDKNHTVSGQLIRLVGCYSDGMLPATQTFIDTFMIGQLPAGTYQIIHKAYMSQAQQWCNKIDSNSVIASLQVSGATGINRNTEAKTFDIYPNPASGKITIPANLIGGRVLIFSSLGALVHKSEVGHGHDIDIHELPPGVYVIKILTARGQMNSRFIKSAGD
ncbi:MAG: T9SS type A sorting domain-containing protein [Bacteroidota bacterium]